MIVSKGNSRDEAYKFVQNLTQNNISMNEVIKSTNSSFDNISKDEIQNCFNLSVTIDTKVIEKKLKDL